MKKVASIFLLSLLVCNVLGFTFVTIWNEWKGEHTYQSSGLVEKNGDQLILKLNLSIPYQSNFSENHSNEKLAIFEGEFFREHKKVYENDTLYVTYQKENINRENFYNLLNEVSENLDDYSKDSSDDSSNKTYNFFKSLVKDYTTFGAKSTVYFWVEDLPLCNYSYSNLFISTELSLISPPPQVA